MFALVVQEARGRWRGEITDRVRDIVYNRLRRNGNENVVVVARYEISPRYVAPRHTSNGGKFARAKSVRGERK